MGFVLFFSNSQKLIRKAGLPQRGIEGAAPCNRNQIVADAENYSVKTDAHIGTRWDVTPCGSEVF